MSYFSMQIRNLQMLFPDVPIEALKAAMITGIEAFAWSKDGVFYVGTTGKLLKDVIREILSYGTEVTQ